MAKSEGQKQSQKHENRLAKLLDGRTVSGSGAPWSHDGDVKTSDLLVEHKWTSKKSFSITETLWMKIWTEAWKIGRTPIFGVHLGNNINLVIMDEHDFLELRSKADRGTNGSGRDDDEGRVG